MYLLWRWISACTLSGLSPAVRLNSLTQGGFKLENSLSPFLSSSLSDIITAYKVNFFFKINFSFGGELCCALATPRRIDLYQKAVFLFRWKCFQHGVSLFWIKPHLKHCSNRQNAWSVSLKPHIETQRGFSHSNTHQKETSLDTFSPYLTMFQPHSWIHIIKIWMRQTNAKWSRRKKDASSTCVRFNLCVHAAVLWRPQKIVREH